MVTRAVTARFASTSASKKNPSANNTCNGINNAGAGAALGAVLFGASAATAVTLLEQPESSAYQYQTLPRQKYPSPEEPPIHGKASHHADFNDPPPRPDLPTYSIDDVAEHCDESSLWYTFRGAVYDLTAFSNGHPGGTPRLLMAAGQDLEPYWEVYRQHLRGHVLEWMEKVRSVLVHAL